MGQLEQSGVLIHGGPLDRGNGGYALGVIRAGSIYEACEAISRDPALALGVYELLSLDRWLAVAGSDEPIDRNEIRRNTNQNFTTFVLFLNNEGF
nr:hypothetical protein [Nitrosomonas nitrosa]